MAVEEQPGRTRGEVSGCIGRLRLVRARLKKGPSRKPQWGDSESLEA